MRIKEHTARGADPTDIDTHGCLWCSVTYISDDGSGLRDATTSGMIKVSHDQYKLGTKDSDPYSRTACILVSLL